MNHFFIFPTENEFYLSHHYKAQLLNLATEKMVSLLSHTDVPGQRVEVGEAALGKLPMFPKPR